MADGTLALVRGLKTSMEYTNERLKAVHPRVLENGTGHPDRNGKNGKNSKNGKH
jgi:hypothetical protein